MLLPPCLSVSSGRAEPAAPWLLHIAIEGVLAIARTAKAATQRQQPEQADQRQRARRGRERAGAVCRPPATSSGGGGVTTSASCTSSPVGLTGHDGRPLQLHYHRLVRRLDRLGDFQRNLGRREQDGRVGGLWPVSIALAFG